MLQLNYQQHQHEINLSEHTTSNVNEIHKYIEHDPSKPITTSKREKRIDKYENAHIQAVAIEFSRTRTFCFKDIRLTDRVGV